jgi:DNA mismatch repair protein MutS2
MMQNFPSDIESRIGFTKVLEEVSSYCKSTLGKQLVGETKFLITHKKINHLLHELEQVSELLEEKPKYVESLFIQDLSESLNKLKVQDMILPEEELIEFNKLIISSAQLKKELVSLEEPKVILNDLADRLDDFKVLISSYSGLFDKEGNISENATPALSAINKSIKKSEKSLRTSTDRLMDVMRDKGYVAETGVSVRNGRPVIPVLALNKNKVSGILHDRSATGKILYIEPYELVEVGNKLSELLLEKKAELIQIRKDLTAKLSEYRQELNQAMKCIGRVDFVTAKAIYSGKIKGEVPSVSNTPIVKWQNAVHPLLYKSLKEQKKKVIPLTLELNEQDRILVVSGPNAGGKSIVMKTVCLLQYMVQSGYAVPVDPKSEFGVFKNLFIDIGDDQSIESNLSTYSSHLSNMKTMISMASKDSMIFIDEFGTGTDPSFGGAIAESVLEKLVKLNAKGIVTTHYGNIKAFATQTSGLVNGAMIFEQKELKPTYQLEIGRPGSSFAFEVAGNIGLQKDIIKNAADKVSGREMQLEDLLLELDKTKTGLSASETELSRKEEHLAKLIKEYRTLKDELFSNKKEIIENAKKEARSILSSANKVVENTIKDIVEANAEKKKTQKARKSLEQGILENKSVKRKKEETKILEIGDSVTMQNHSDRKGEIIEIDRKKALVAFGNIKTWVPLINLTIAQEKKPQKKSSSKQHVVSNMNYELDIRGKRTDEAIRELILFMDDAYVTGKNEFRILHGKGDGILRKFVREELKKTGYVESFGNEHIERGGDGVTLVKLK